MSLARRKFSRRQAGLPPASRSPARATVGSRISASQQAATAAARHMVAEAHSPAPQSPLIPQRKTRAELEAEITALRAELAQSAAGRAPQRATPVVARQVFPESKTGGGDMMTIRGADDASGSRAQDSRPPVSGRDLLLEEISQPRPPQQEKLRGAHPLASTFKKVLNRKISLS